MRSAIFTIAPLLLIAASYCQEFPWAPNAPMKAVRLRDGVSNAAISCLNGSFINDWTREKLTGDGVALRITLKDGTVLEPKWGNWKPAATSVVGAKKLNGQGWKQAIHLPHLDIDFTLQAVDSQNYAIAQAVFKPTDNDLDAKSIELLRVKGEGLHVVGRTPGSPVVSDSFFMGVEHPMSLSKVSEDGTIATCSIERLLPIRKGTRVTYSAVVGVAAPGQIRRAFLTYIESTRPRPYQPFLHYNSWYDIGYFTPYNEKDCLDRIQAFGENLVRKRGVAVSSYLFDDGWDNYNSVWEFHKGFPTGFLPLRDLAAKYGAGPGVWLSPWGGYGDPRKTRLAYGKAHRMEVDSQGYALSGPNYYKRFHDVTLDFVTRQGINQFKFDGTGSPDKHTPGSQFDSDFDAAITLIGDLRRAQPKLFVNLTTGTWPSPFWLRIADSIWRGGSDHSFAGVGSFRQQWITYRDSDLFHGIAERGPLFPINSLMLHGIIYAKNAHNLSASSDEDFRDEVRDYFGCGTQLQEMYITPSLLNERNWDDLAESAKWSQANAATLKDVHWIGGDPSKLDVYGFAAWSPKRSILVLRNPSDQPQAFSIDPAFVLELPQGAAAHFTGKSPYSDESEIKYDFEARRSKVVDLKPFQVLTLELEPVR